MNNNYFYSQNTQNSEYKNKIEYLKNELLDSEKCREFSRKLCEYIKENSKN